MPIFIGVFWIGSDVGRWVGWLVGIKVDDGGLCGNCNLGGIWDLRLQQQQQQHVFAGKPVGKQQTGVNELVEGHRAGHHHSLGTKRSSIKKEKKSH